MTIRWPARLTQAIPEGVTRIDVAAYSGGGEEPVATASADRPEGAGTTSMRLPADPTAVLPAGEYRFEAAALDGGSQILAAGTATASLAHNRAAQVAITLVVAPGVPEPLAWHTLTSEIGTHFVHLAWPEGLGDAMVERRGGPGGSATRLVPAPASTFVDAVQAGGSLEYEVLAGDRVFAATVQTADPPECVAEGGGGDGGGEGPPECSWAPTGPGETPFGICQQGRPIPIVPPTDLLTWTDAARRQGYLIEFGTVRFDCANLPPVYSGIFVALTSSRSVALGENPGLDGFTGIPAWEILAERAGYGLGEWPALTSGGTYGWRLRPIAGSGDRRILAVGQTQLIPRIFRIE